jgi:hypothetical protein
MGVKMKQIEIIKNVIPPIADLLDLYNDVGWLSYTKDSMKKIN